MADITMNGKDNGKGLQKNVIYPLIKDILLFVAFLTAAGIFLKVSSDVDKLTANLNIVRAQVQELIDIHPRVQGGTIQ